MLSDWTVRTNFVQDIEELEPLGEDRYLVTLARQNHFVTAQYLKNNLQRTIIFQIMTKTAWNRLHASGMKSRELFRIPPTQHYRQQHMQCVTTSQLESEPLAPLCFQQCVEILSRGLNDGCVESEMKVGSRLTWVSLGLRLGQRQHRRWSNVICPLAKHWPLSHLRHVTGLLVDQRWTNIGQEVSLLQTLDGCHKSFCDHSNLCQRCANVSVLAGMGWHLHKTKTRRLAAALLSNG